jgi:uncharacterized membrane protein
LKNNTSVQNDKINQLHQMVVDVLKKVKVIIKDHKNKEDDKLTTGERFSEALFRMGRRWTLILLFTGIIITWVSANVFLPQAFRFDPFPFPLITFLLAGVAAIQAPFIMMSQHRQAQKHGKMIALNLKVENEVLTLHRSITILMEQQLQQILENQAITLIQLQELQKKTV